MLINRKRIKNKNGIKLVLPYLDDVSIFGLKNNFPIKLYHPFEFSERNSIHGFQLPLKD